MNTDFLVVLISILLVGCTATHLVYVHDASLGIDVAVSTEGTGRLVLGYDRETYAIVPRKADGEDAMSLASFGCVYSKGLGEVSFNHFVSTGLAAENIVNSEKGLDSANKAIFGGNEKCEQ